MDAPRDYHIVLSDVKDKDKYHITYVSDLKYTNRLIYKTETDSQI